MWPTSFSEISAYNPKFRSHFGMDFGINNLISESNFGVFSKISEWKFQNWSKKGWVFSQPKNLKILGFGESKKPAADKILQMFAQDI